MADIVKVDITLADGSVQTLTNAPAAEAVTITEIDVNESDGTVEKFTPEA